MAAAVVATVAVAVAAAVVVAAVAVAAAAVAAVGHGLDLFFNQGICAAYAPSILRGHQPGCQFSCRMFPVDRFELLLKPMRPRYAPKLLTM